MSGQTRGATVSTRTTGQPGSRRSPPPQAADQGRGRRRGDAPPGRQRLTRAPGPCKANDQDLHRRTQPPPTPPHGPPRPGSDVVDLCDVWIQNPTSQSTAPSRGAGGFLFAEGSVPPPHGVGDWPGRDRSQPSGLGLIGLQPEHVLMFGLIKGLQEVSQPPGLGKLRSKLPPDSGRQQ